MGNECVYTIKVYLKSGNVLEFQCDSCTVKYSSIDSSLANISYKGALCNGLPKYIDLNSVEAITQHINEVKT